MFAVIGLVITLVAATGTAIAAGCAILYAMKVYEMTREDEIEKF